MSIAVSHSGFNAGVTVAEIDLRFLSDFLGDAQVGKVGFAYVVDAARPGAGELVEGARCRQGSVRRCRRSRPLHRRRTAQPLTSGTDADGHSVLTASSAVPKLGWHVFFEQPTAQALTPIRDQLVRIALLIALGLVVAILAGTLAGAAHADADHGAARRRAAARRRRFQPPHRGAAPRTSWKNWPTSSTAWPASSHETYSGLECKVEERTRDLAQSINELKVLEEVGRAVASSLDLNAVLPTVAARALEITHADAVLIYGYDAGEPHVQPDRGDRHRQGGRGRASRDRRRRQRARRGRRAGRADRDSRSRLRPPSIRCAMSRSRPASIRCWWCRWSTRRAFWDRWWCCGEAPANSRQNLIGLMKTFAHQSVLAMRNARLFTEVDHKSRELGDRAHHRAPAGRQAAGADRPAQGLEQVAGGAGREAARRDRAHPPARAFPRAAGGATDRLLRRP